MYYNWNFRKLDKVKEKSEKNDDYGCLFGKEDEKYEHYSIGQDEENVENCPVTVNKKYNDN